MNILNFDHKNENIIYFPNELSDYPDFLLYDRNYQLSYYYDFLNKCAFYVIYDYGDYDDVIRHQEVMHNKELDQNLVDFLAKDPTKFDKKEALEYIDVIREKLQRSFRVY